jgi:hypothetical protein
LAIGFKIRQRRFYRRAAEDAEEFAENLIHCRQFWPIRGHRRLEFERGVRSWVLDDQDVGVQRDPLWEWKLAAVFEISEHRVAELGKLQTNLMLAAGFKVDG